MAGVEQEAPGGVRVGHRPQLGGLAGGVQGGGAPLVQDQVLGALGRAGVLDQAQGVHQPAAGLPPEEQPPAGPVVKVEAAAGQGGGGGQAVAAAGALEKGLVAGHGPRQGQLADKVVVRLGEGELHRPLVPGADAQLLGPGQARQHLAAARDGGKLHRVGRAGPGRKDTLEGVDEVLGGDGVGGVLPAGGLVGQARLEGEGIGQPAGGDGPALAQVGLGLAGGVQPDKAPVEVFAGQDVLGGRGDLGVQVGGYLLHKPGEAVDPRPRGAPGQG